MAVFGIAVSFHPKYLRTRPACAAMARTNPRGDDLAAVPGDDHATARRSIRIDSWWTRINDRWILRLATVSS
jgi:hypothetical protein